MDPFLCLVRREKANDWCFLTSYVTESAAKQFCQEKGTQYPDNTYAVAQLRWKTYAIVGVEPI